MNPPTVLVIEDNEIARDEVERVLLEAEFNVLKAEDGETGIKICKKQKIDLVLLDIVLPQMTGLQCYDEIKE